TAPPVPGTEEEEPREAHRWAPLQEEEREDGAVRKGRRFPVLLPVFLLSAAILAACAFQQWRSQGAADGRYLVGIGLLLAAGIVYVARLVLSRKDRRGSLKSREETDGSSGFLKGEKKAEDGIPGSMKGEKETEDGRSDSLVERKGMKERAGWDAETEILSVRQPLRREWTFVSENTLRYESFRMSRTPFVIGKEAGMADGVLGGSFISRAHARVERQGEELFLTDCHSTNGTYLNGKRLESDVRYPLKEGDEVMFADQKYIFSSCRFVSG
ncbi:MAG: FHA domain-containing protein, partial [Lachnospiraceae bacterium]|nr:FHA domain-containing protein [Lachnospiraceae bacterium]